MKKLDIKVIPQIADGRITKLTFESRGQTEADEFIRTFADASYHGKASFRLDRDRLILVTPIHGIPCYEFMFQITPELNTMLTAFFMRGQTMVTYEQKFGPTMTVTVPEL